MDDDGYWLDAVDIIRGVIDAMRHRQCDATTEERVALDECDRRLAQIDVMTRARRRAASMGALPCWVCGGSPMVSSETGFDVWRPVVSCQVCGTEMGPDVLGVTDRVLPADRFASVERALVKAWNAKAEAAPSEPTGDERDEI